MFELLRTAHAAVQSADANATIRKVEHLHGSQTRSRHEKSSRYDRIIVGTECALNYDYDNSEVDGLEIVRRLTARNFKTIVLCTAEYWKPSIRDVANDMHITLCPKPLPIIHIVQATIEAPVHRNVLVIDDDENIRLVWQIVKGQLNISNLALYESMEACEKANLQYTEYDYAFLDKHIPASSWDIEHAAKHLKEHGVKRIVLSTGERLSEAASVQMRTYGIDTIMLGKIPESWSTIS
ncbi:MAG: hypothetical protein HY696_01990 [Deltaproteobacteria bacterium]|nr:hypothetical protein [Deltaproteobacteria bacterium]